MSRLSILRRPAALCLLPGLLSAATAAAASVSLHPVEDYQVRISSGPGSATGSTIRATEVTATNDFYFGYLKFDVSSLAAGQPKTLALSPTADGSSLRLVALSAEIADTDGTQDGDFRDIPTVSNPDNNALRRSWFDSHAAGRTLLGIYDFPPVDPASGAPEPLTLDVTAVVDAWISGTLPNYGFAFFTTAADREGAASQNAVVASDNPSFPAANRPTLTQVPEPGAASLGLLAAAGLLAGRKRPAA